jgi:hypothetical protein
MNTLTGSSVEIPHVHAKNIECPCPKCNADPQALSGSPLTILGQ